MSWPKRCNCCGREYSRDEWLSLPWVGLQPPDAPELELRNCGCRSTIAVELVDGWNLPEESAA